MPSRLRRWLRPSAFLFVLILFPLPWLEVQCDQNAARTTRTAVGGGSSSAPLSAVEEVREWLLDHLGLPSSRWGTLFSQSGLDAALGSYSSGDPSVNLKNTAEDKRLRDHLHVAVAMALLPFVLLTGFVVSLGWWRGTWRRWLMSALALSA
ncbi:MAG TPA: hypothetical protein VGY58_23285, partial [Gemmataceae bacterium]|nr:hypothetical protein [Gemmataceae bacterium]